MALIIKAIAGLTALVLLVVTLFGSILTLGGLLLVALKVLIIAVFIGVLTMIVLSIVRDRSRRRHEMGDI